MSEHISDRAQTSEGQDAIRADVSAIIAKTKLSLAAIAKESGVGYSTLSAWMNGTYPGRADRVATDMERWLASREAASRAQRAMPDAPGFLQTTTADEFIGALEHAQHMPDLVVITGAPGVGKTTTCEEYRRRTPNVWMLTGEPAYRSPALLLEDLAETLGLESYSSRRVSREIIKRLRGTAGLIIVDEAQLLSSEALDQLRSLQDQAKIGVALVGNETVYGRLEGKSRAVEFAQLFSRVGMRQRRPSARKADIDTLLDAWRVTEVQHRRVLHNIAKLPGALRNLTKTLRLAHTLAAGDGRELHLDHLRAAWQRLSDTDVSEAA